ncbi:MAG: ankyrin repeat domain-containing protein [Parachlamydiaceae bacterium]|nr:ankyrin repeat domain-containing protein [Parachlamydiaceae bacterium]
MITNTYFHFKHDDKSLTITSGGEARIDPKLTAHDALQLILNSENKIPLQNSTSFSIQEISQTIFDQYRVKYNNRCFLCKWIDSIKEACGVETELTKLQILKEKVSSVFNSSLLDDGISKSEEPVGANYSLDESEKLIESNSSSSLEINALSTNEKIYIKEILLNFKEDEIFNIENLTEEAQNYWINDLWMSPGAVEYLLNKGMSANIEDSENCLPILRAVHLCDNATSFYNKNIIELLLKNEAKVDEKNFQGKTSLHVVARLGFQEIMTLLLEHGANIEARDNDYCTPLHVAAYCGSLNSIKFLLANDANVLANRNGQASSEIARYEGGWPAVGDFLYQEEQKKRIENEKKNPTPYVFSGRLPPNYNSGKKRIKKSEAKQNIVANSSEVMSTKTGRCHTKLHSFLENPLQLTDHIIELLDKGINIESKNLKGETPFHIAVKHDYEEMVNILLEYGGNIEALDDEEKTPFLTAACHAKPSTLQFLLDLKANKDARTKNGLTALHLAALHGNLENVNFLLENKIVDIEEKDYKAQTPLHQAVQEKLKDLTYDGEIIPQHNLAVIRALILELRANINAQDNEGRTPLAIAIKRGNETVANLLIELGADTETSD